MGDQSFEETTIAEARAYVNSGLRKGVKCPCCTQYCKVYQRQIHSTMSRMLISLFRLGQGYHHLNDIMSVKNGWGDFAKLAYWGLIEEMVDTGIKDGRTTGYWRITSKGIQFVLREIPLPKYAEVYNGRLLRVIGDDVFIDQTLGHKFNYRELMA